MGNEEVIGQVKELVKQVDWSDKEQAKQARSIVDEISRSLNISAEVLLGEHHAKVLPRKKVLVFLPYKASMWDCMESVWRAAVEDEEHCKVYVVPIPYADLNPDHSVKEWHCEKNMFPDYVKVTDWQEIDLEKLYPDAIFIHNPYDNTNYVTSVTQEFYTERLKHYTDHLIYIPYFVTKENVDPLKCSAVGVVNATHVIIQDDIILKVYEKNYKLPYGKDKFLVLGSPKLDKVRQLKRRDYPLTEEVRGIIQDKKVIFYNTSMGGFLEKPQESFAKVEQLFRAVKEDVRFVLWWRPHPLLETTIKAMMPEYLPALRNLEKYFFANDIGIYDEQADFYAGFAWSDAYYGDTSSLLTMYECLHKPAMLIDYEKDCHAELDELAVWLKDGFPQPERIVGDGAPAESGRRIYEWIMTH